MRKSLFNIMKNFQWRELFFRLWKYVIIAVGVPTVILIFVFFKSYIDTTYKEYEEVFATSSNKSAGIFKDYADDFFDGSVEIAKLHEVYRFLSDTELKNDYMDNVLSSMDNVLNYTGIRNELLKFVNEYEILDSVWLYSLKNDELITAYPANKIETEDEHTVVDKALENAGKCSIFRNTLIRMEQYTPMQAEIVSVSFPVYTSTFNEVSGILIFNFDYDALIEKIFYDNAGGSVFLLDGNGEIVPIREGGDADEKRISSLSLDDIVGQMQGKDYIIKRDGFDTYCCIAYADMDFAFVFSAGASGTKNMLGMIVRMGITVFITAILAMIFLSYIISMMLYNFMVAVVFEFGAYEGKDVKEISDQKYLGKRFMSAMDHNTNIESELVSKVSQLKDTQVLALQTQINPHFIFNTLNLVNLMIIEIAKKDCSPSKVVSLLSDVLNYSLNTEEFTTTFAEELKYAYKYVEIEKLKCDDCFELITDIDESVMNGRTVKFSLQPILENCINHGFDDDTIEKGIIKLNIFREQNKVHIVIKDNGGGTSEKKINELNNSFKNIEVIRRGRHIGLTNVNHRLKIIFGEEAVMRVFNEDDGFVVEIIQPYEV